ncbi:hypothetical protein HanRHA438_Chr14g0635351 [Helianthus annuus]|nr:hypothetical protein HanRHA438_Chr14g0635351 [Helianthus annuus]
MHTSLLCLTIFLTKRGKGDLPDFDFSCCVHKLQCISTRLEKVHRYYQMHPTCDIP